MSRNSKTSSRDGQKSLGTASNLSLPQVVGSTTSANFNSRKSIDSLKKPSTLITAGTNSVKDTQLQEDDKGSTTLAETQSQLKRRTESINKLKSQSGGDISHEIVDYKMLSKNNSESGDLPLRRGTGLSIYTAVNSLNEDLPSIGHDLKYTKMFLQKQGINNLSM